MNGIKFSASFDEFLNGLSDSKQQSLMDEINSFRDGDYDVAPKDCAHVKGRQKLLFQKSEIVVLYDSKDDNLYFINGVPLFSRAA